MDIQKNILGQLNLQLTKAEYHRDCHFAAGQRAYKSRKFGHISIIFLNVLLGSVLFFHMTNLEWQKSTMPWISAVLSFLAALISALMLQFRPDEEFHGHRSVANQFSQIAAKLSMLRAELLAEQLTEKKAWEMLKELNQQHYQIRQQADNYIVGPKIRNQYSQQYFGDHGDQRE